MQQLPDRLRQQLDVLSRAIQRARFARVLSWTCLLAVLVFAAAMLTDRFVGIAVFSLRLTTALILAIISLGLVAAAAAFAFGRLSSSRLAQLVERKFPDLQERLLTLTTLDAAGAQAGPQVDALKQETVERSTDLDVRVAFSWDATRRALRLAGGAVLLTALTLLAWPAAARFGDRFVHAWTDAAYGYEIEVSPAGGNAALGQPLLVTARLTGDESRFPKECTLHVRTDAGIQKLPMTPTDAGPFAAVLPSMPAEATLVVEAGERSTTVVVHGKPALRVLEARVQILSPRYTNSKFLEFLTLDPSKGTTFRALQYSHLHWEFQLDDVPEEVNATWTSKPFHLPLHKLIVVNAIADTLGKQTGEVRFVSRDGIVTTVPLGEAIVWPDAPPVFSSVRLGNGTAGEYAVDPEAPLRISATLEDSVGLNRLDLEWRVNGGEPKIETLQKDLLPRYAGEWAVSLRGKVKDGDRLELRLRGTDNRHLPKDSVQPGIPAEDLAPLTAVEPATATGWFALPIKTGAAPLEKQQLLAEHDDVAARLKAIRKDVAAVQADTTKLAAAGHISPAWTPAQSRTVGELRTKNSRNQAALSGLGSAALARLAKDVADRELGSVDKSFAKTDSSEATAAGREIHLKHAESELQNALKKIDDLLSINEAVAQERLKLWEAEDLALREDALAADNAKADDPDRLKEQQDAITKAFEKWAAENKEIQKAKAASQRLAAEEMAQRADKLARQQSSSAAKNAEAMAGRLKKALAGVAEKQAKLAADAARLERDILAGLDGADVPVPAAAAKKAAEHLDAGAAEPALAEQSTTIAGLDRSKERLVQLTADPKAQAKDLIARQQKLIDDLEKLGNDFARIGPDETVKRLADIHTRQKGIEKAIEKLKVPDGQAALRKDAVASAAEAAQAVQKRDLVPARDAMEKTRDTLRRLQAALPDAPPPADVDQQKEQLREAARAKVETLAQAQKELHAETLKTLAAAMKPGPEGEGSGNEIAKSLEQLKDDVMKLSLAKDDEKAMAKESAAALDEAAREMKLAQDKREEGKLEMADKAERDANLKLEQAGKMLDKLAASLPKPGEPERELIQSMQDAKLLLSKPSPNSPLPSPETMQQAAKAIRKTAELTGNPMTARSPGAAGPANVPDEPLPIVLGADWGNLPGEVRTRLAREWRARYGPEYEEIIQRYFRNISKSK